jgi:hypothetical protein
VLSKGLKPDFHLIGSRVETRRFHATGQTGFKLYSPPPVLAEALGGAQVDHVVAVQVAFERHVLKPDFHLIGARVETRRLSDMGSYGSGGVNVYSPTTCTLMRPFLDKPMPCGALTWPSGPLGATSPSA